MIPTRKTIAWISRTLAVCLCVHGTLAVGEVLPEERFDVLYHYYSGGGVDVDGPSILMRKNFGEKVSVYGNYYVDAVSSASIDVVSTASAYSETRKQKSLGVDWQRGDTRLSVGFSNSDESDYTADIAQITVSQSVFSDLTTISLGFAQGHDDVRQAGDEDFAEEIDRRHYRLGLSQILTRNLVMGINYEAISDEGYLNSPYRSVRFVDTDLDDGYDYEGELYPGTRTSNAASLRFKYYLPYRAAAHVEYRYFTDTWGIDAQSAEIGYSHPLASGWTIDGRVRFYEQTSADFYSDLFPRSEAFNFRSRDKELSTFSSQTFGVGASYEFARNGWGFFDKGSVSIYYDALLNDYEDFRDVTVDADAGTEPLYNFSADVLRVFVSIWF